jgi:hypothetical protein
MRAYIQPLLRFCVVFLLVSWAPARTFDPRMSSMNPTAGLFVGGVSPYVDVLGDWHPHGPPGPLCIQTSMLSVGHHPDIDALPEGEEYLAGSGLALLIALCR